MWKKKANVVYNSFEKIQEYQNSIASNEKNVKLEQNWVDKNLIPLMDIMGTDMMWQSITQNDDIKISGLDVRKSTRILEKKPAEHNIEANFSGTRESGGHWYSRKKGEYRFFDAYQEFQINGTNLWCQTFALMYVCGRLPLIFPNSITKYYYYNYNVLLFIKECLQKTDLYKIKYYKLAIDNCLKEPHICINAAEIDLNILEKNVNNLDIKLPSFATIKNDFVFLVQMLNAYFDVKFVLNKCGRRRRLPSNTISISYKEHTQTISKK